MRWVTIFSLSIFAHLVAAMGYVTFVNVNQTNGAINMGENGIEVGLGQAGTYSDMVNQLLHPPKPITEEIVIPEKPKIVKKKKLIKLNVVKKTVVKQTPPKIKTKVKQGDYTLVKSPTKKPLPKTESATEPKKTKVTQKTPSIASVKATGRSNHKSTGGEKGNAKNYFSQLMAWLNQHKKYPVQAKKGKQQGTVTIKFSIDPNGLVLDKQVVASSGHALLDQSALQMLVAAAPLPQPPANHLKRGRLVLQIPIEFSLVTNKTYRE